MRQINTLGDVLHAVGNSLCVISTNAQYLIGKQPLAGSAKSDEELRIVWDEAERIASLLSMVPQGMGALVIVQTDGEDATNRGDALDP